VAPDGIPHADPDEDLRFVQPVLTDDMQRVVRLTKIRGTEGT